MDIFAVQRWQTWHIMWQAYFRKWRGCSSGSLLSCIYCLWFVLLWCLTLKSIRETRFSLSGFVWHLCMCLGILCIEICNTHPHDTLKNTLTQAEAHSVKHTSLHIHKQTLSMQCSKYNDCVLAPFSLGWWQVFFLLTWLKWNPIISVMALQLFFCFEGVSLLESPLLDPNVLSKSVMRNGANVQWRQRQM